MQQYHRIKRNHSDAILFFRLGDFYEMFEGDAKVASSILNLTLTSRNSVPMCGVPHHAAQNYIRRLLDAGKKVAVCEQTSLPEGGRGLAERSVVEVVTPGTVVDEEFLDRTENNFLTAIGGGGGASISIASVDLSTGELLATSIPEEDAGEGIRRELQKLEPKELLLQESLIEHERYLQHLLRDRGDLMINRLPDWEFDVEVSEEKLLSQFEVASLKGFGISDHSRESIRSVGVILDYVGDTQRNALPHITDINLYGASDSVGIDHAAQRNLELVANLSDGGRSHTLLHELDHTKTAMGARLLRRWIVTPLIDLDAIEGRLDDVEALYRNQLILSTVRNSLASVLDLERLCSRVALDRANAKDLLAIRGTLEATIEVNETASTWLRPTEVTSQRIVETGELLDLLTRSIHPEPSVALGEGRLIADGYSSELDELRAMENDRKAVLDAYLAEEREATGIRNLKLRHNRIIGRYLEVTKGNAEAVPEHFIRRQTLVGSERFTTERLGEIESTLNSTNERIISLERSLFLEIRDSVKSRVPLLQTLAGAIAKLDCFQSLAYSATIHGYVRPSIDQTTRISIDSGRHPVVESHLRTGEFVPNDTRLGLDGITFGLITGPNMAGKSTYLRQVALIVLMAQMGSFVPAAEATIGIVDHIFCRVGAHDNLAQGESTFLVEMSETAHILRTMSEHSLVIMDEVGRGTGTNDGMSIAWAVTEHILNEGVRTLFATHFHELIAIAHIRKIDLVLEVVEHDDDILFLKRLKPGAADHSYGIHVARLAGVPEHVVNRARELLQGLLIADSGEKREFLSVGRHEGAPPDQGLFDELELVRAEIESVDIDGTTPMDALLLIDRWKRRLMREASESRGDDR